MGYDDDWTSGDDERRFRYSINARVMMIVITSLYFIIVLFHFYARCVLRRQMRRRQMLHQLHLGITAAQAQIRPAEQPKIGLDASVIATLPIFVYKQSNETVECSVCLSALEEEEVARLLPNCKHTFHTQCIDLWLNSHSTYPICRTEVEPHEQAEAGERGGSAGASAPPLESVKSSRRVHSIGEETSGGLGQSSKGGGSSSSWFNSFKRILSREKSEKRLQVVKRLADAGGSESDDDAELSDNTLLALRYLKLADRRKNGK